MRWLTKINEYFFEIEPDEAPDYVGASLFYGTCLLGVLIIGYITVSLIIS